jgi:hypothetical protein
MTNQEMQRAMNFIVEQEAKTAAKIDALAEAQKGSEERWSQSDERWKRIEERWSRTEQGIRALLTIAEIHEREINTLGQGIQNMSETTRATDDRLNTLINVVERHISEGRNGKP